MNSRWVGSACVVGGTAIGAGVLVLPIVCASVNVLQSIFVMLGSWAVTYFMALVMLDVNIRNGSGKTLGDLGQKYMGRWGRWLGDGSVKALCYVLLVAYFCGGGQLLEALLSPVVDGSMHAQTGVHVMAALMVCFLLCNISAIDRWNKALFMGFCVLLLVMVGVLQGVAVDAALHHKGAALCSLPWGDMRLLPVLFTSFGFQVVFHTLTDYCQGDKVALKKAFFVGSSIPCVVYMLWTVSVLYVVGSYDATTYEHCVQGSATLYDLMQSLGRIFRRQGVGAWLLPSEFMFSLMSILAIVTSMIGVGLGLMTSWRAALKGHDLTKGRCLHSVLLTVVPSWLIAFLCPGFFLRFLSFAGCILVFIAVFFPLLVFRESLKEKGVKVTYPIIANRFCILFCVLWGISVILAELVYA